MQVSSCWTQPSADSESLAILCELSTSHAQKGGSCGREILSLIQAKNYSALVNYNLPVNDYGWDGSQLLHCRLALGFFQKLEDLDIGVDKEAVAYQKFCESEAVCRTVNEQFSAIRWGRTFCAPRDALLIEGVRREIRRILGRAPRLSDLRLCFGPGATTSTKKRDANPQTKMSKGFACSPELLASGRLPELLREVPHWVAASDGVVEYQADGSICDTVPVSLHSGKLCFVPKSAKTYRSIVVEPVLNGFLQQGIGGILPSVFAGEAYVISISGTSLGTLSWPVSDPLPMILRHWTSRPLPIALQPV